MDNKVKIVTSLTNVIAIKKAVRLKTIKFSFHIHNIQASNRVGSSNRRKSKWKKEITEETSVNMFAVIKTRISILFF